jgi:D-arabinose 5-phosphate isomerase GutQ
MVRIAHAVAEDLADVRVERQLALFDQLHRAQRGHEFRDRGDAEQRVVVDGLGRRGGAGQPLAAEMLAVDDISVTDHGNRQAGQGQRGVVHDRLQLAGEGGGLRFGQRRGRCGCRRCGAG